MSLWRGHLHMNVEKITTAAPIAKLRLGSKPKRNTERTVESSVEIPVRSKQQYSANTTEAAATMTGSNLSRSLLGYCQHTS